MGRSMTAAEELSALPALEPMSQAEMLTRLAQQARLVRMALSSDRHDAANVACSFERALGEAMDAEAQDESEVARLQLASVLTDARNAGLTVSASVDELELDGVLGAQRWPVLTAVLGSAPA
jgi:hypothetical protein